MRDGAYEYLRSVLRVGCIAEAFIGGTATVSHESMTPLTRAVYETILRDEARHRRMGGLYFEWALARIDEAELARLGRVLHAGLQGLAPFWKPTDAARARAEVACGDLQALGWLGATRFAPVAREVVVRDILDPLATIGIALTDEQPAALLG